VAAVQWPGGVRAGEAQVRAEWQGGMASFNDHGGGRTQESFKVENSTLLQMAEGQGIGKNLIVWAKAVWDAAEDAGDHCLHSAISPASPVPIGLS